MVAQSPSLARVSARHRIIDVDSHVTEPADLWTSRIPSKWGALVPHVAYDERTSQERWYVGDQRLPGVGAFALAGWREFPPGHPPTLADADAAAFDPVHRIRRLDEFGIDTQLLYPNLLGFYSHLFAALPERELAVQCVRAYNDFLVDFCATDPRRLIPLMMLPYWDVDASLAEMERAAPLGHRGIIMGTDYSKVGLPALADDYWAPILDAAQGLELTVNFHIGFAALTTDEARRHQRIGDRPRFAKETALFMLGNANQIAEIITTGVCERFPRLNFVSIESGAGYLPYLLEALDWQWQNSGARNDLRSWLLPSEYFRRQIYGSFWFEAQSFKTAALVYEDNIMFESDFPHPTSLSPGPCSSSLTPREMVDLHLRDLPDAVVAKLLHENAARIYKL